MKYLSDQEDKDIDAAIRQTIERARLYRSCLTCEWFDEPRELCTLGGANARPPARVIAIGCVNYSEVPPF